MPVFAEVATSQRELRVQPSYAPPLPSLAAQESALGRGTEYDVIVVGAGPSGLLATLLLSRYGIPDSRLLCIDTKPDTLRSGQADGLQPRTLEVIESLGLHHEIIDQGCAFWEISFWDAKDGGGIKRTSYGPDVDVASQYPHEITIHQGRIERIFDDDLKRYSSKGVERSTTLKSVEVEEDSNSDYPIVIKVQKDSSPCSKDSLSPGKHELRCRYLIGADGAHSVVRKAVGIPLVGESREYIWGVVDFVADSRFPDIRRKSMIQSATGSCMIIPRERIATGEYLTRLYVHMDETESEEMQKDKGSAENAKDIARQKRQRVSVEKIFDKANKVMQPYAIRVKQGSKPDWWAAYEIGQRMCESFIKRDSGGHPRVFLAGDACHTHSPKAGQGMNVSMMDTYNLAWKLAHVLQGVTPDMQAVGLLNSYEHERRDIARELIEYDRALSTAFSNKGKEQGSDVHLNEDQLNEVWKIGHGFTSGCGIEYRSSDLIRKDIASHVQGAAYLEGVVRPGRRLLNCAVQRHTDGKVMQIHEEIPSFGRFSLLVMLSTDLLDLYGRSAEAVKSMSQLAARYRHGLLHPFALHPLDEDIRGIDWDTLPSAIYENVQMSFYSARPGQRPIGKDTQKWSLLRATDDAYAVYGISRSRGAFVVLRPDQIVGMVAGLDEDDKVRRYLDLWLAKSKTSV